MEVGHGEACNWCGAVCALALVSCAQAPISERAIPAEEIRLCQALSEQVSVAERAALRGGIEAARASGVAYGISLLGISFSTVIPYVAGGYAITSGIGGAIEAQDRRDAIVVQCLRDKGYKVY